MDRIQSISIVGMGALGILYGDYFVRHLGVDTVTFIADERRIEKYRGLTVTCNGRKCDFRMSDGAQPEKPADLLIFAVKGTALGDAIREAVNLVGPGTAILSLLNGIVSEEIIESAYGKGHVISCVAQGMDAVKLGNALTYAHMGQLFIGLLPEEADRLPLFFRVKELFDHISLPYVADADIRLRLWRKWMLNVGVNQVVAVFRGTYETVQKPGKPREMMLAAMREVIRLAQAENITLTEKDLLDYTALVDTLNPAGMPSMRQDGIERRPSEVEFFAGTVLEKAAKYGLDVPVNKELYTAIKKMEADY